MLESVKVAGLKLSFPQRLVEYWSRRCVSAAVRSVFECVICLMTVPSCRCGQGERPAVPQLRSDQRGAHSPRLGQSGPEAAQRRQLQEAQHQEDRVIACRGSSFLLLLLLLSVSPHAALDFLPPPPPPWRPSLRQLLRRNVLGAAGGFDPDVWSGEESPGDGGGEAPGPEPPAGAELWTEAVVEEPGGGHTPVRPGRTPALPRVHILHRQMKYKWSLVLTFSPWCAFVRVFQSVHDCKVKVCWGQKNRY